MIKILNFKKLTLGLIFMAGSLALQGHASVLEEVIVTAQKREQNLQDVSVSVTAYSGDTMRELGIDDPKDIAVLMPNVSAQIFATYPTFNIRGVQLTDFGDGNESPIGFYIDEVYYGTPAGQTASLFDISRAEVLRGPQGTLFGRNSTGGLVHFITNKPTDEFEVSGSLELASDDEVIAQTAVGGALSDSVRGRIAARLNQRDGWQKGGAGQELGDADTWAFRAMLEVDVTDNLTALFTANAADIDNKQNGVTAIGLNNPNIPVIAGPPGTPAIFPVPCTDQGRILSGQCVTFNGATSSTSPERPGTLDNLESKTEIKGASLRLTWDLGNDMELVSLTAFNSVDKFLKNDADGTADPLGLSLYTVESKSFSQEVRLSGSSDSMNWIVGVFYYDDEKDPLIFDVPNVIAQLNGGSTFAFRGDSRLDSESWAVFGQTEYHLSEQWTLIGGLRFTDELKELVISDNLDNPSIIPGLGIPFLVNEEIDETEVTWRFGVDWRPTDETLAYLSISTGYKSGAFNTTFANPNTTAPSDSETVLNYELGVKTAFLDDRLRFNASVFYSDYSDLQVVIVPPGSVSGAVVNAGDADIYGMEIEITWQATENLDVIFGLGLLDSELDSQEIRFDGNEMPFAPSESANVLVRYELPLRPFDGSLVWTNSFQYVGKHFQAVGNEFTSEQESYSVWDTVMRWNSGNSNYFVELFMKNVADEEYTTGRYSVSGLGWAASAWDRQQHGGIRVGFDF